MLRLNNVQMSNVNGNEEDKDTDNGPRSAKCFKTVGDQFMNIEVNLASYITNLDYSGTEVKHVYNPIDYAGQPHKLFLNKYLDGEKKVLFLGMNPGPWGMCQTGVPFGDVDSCLNFLGIFDTVHNPPNSHPKRPVSGFECNRKEVSGQRFWNLFKTLSGTPEQFFRNAFVCNHCPVALMKESGKNVTPPEMPIDIRTMIVEACDKALLEMLDLLKPEIIIGIGKFAEKRAKDLVKKNGRKITVGFLMHPSPINPQANKGWNDIARQSLVDLDVIKYLKPDELI